MLPPQTNVFRNWGKALARDFSDLDVVVAETAPQAADTARIDGYGGFEIFWRIAFPIAIQAIVTTVILNFILLWNEFLYAVVPITDDSKRSSRRTEYEKSYDMFGVEKS